MEQSLSLYQRLLIVQEKVTTVSKTGFNSFKDYKYAVLKDVLDVVKPELTSAGVHLTATTCNSVIGANSATVTVEVTLTNVDKPTEQLVTVATGYAQDGKDGKGDKAIYIATTGAFKYALLIMFGLAQADGDPEHDSNNAKVTSRKTKATVAKDDDLDF